MKRKAQIPVYNLKDRGIHTFMLGKISDQDAKGTADGAHRDDNYLLVYQESGLTRIMIDFKEVVMEGPAVCCVLPGQVHYGIAVNHALAWVIAIEPEWIQQDVRTALMEAAFTNATLPVQPSRAALLKGSLELLEKFDASDQAALSTQVLHSMLDVCLGLFVSVWQQTMKLLTPSSGRPALISMQFRKLLAAQFRTMKSPAQYAAALHLSLSYLNEAVRETTGYPVSYWIHREIVLEAQRMLFYTGSTVKEIAVLMGYTDSAYFIRMFGKVAGQTPLQFRKKYRG